MWGLDLGSSRECTYLFSSVLWVKKFRAPLKTLGFAKNFAGAGVRISGSHLERGLRGHLCVDLWLTRGFFPFS